MPKKDYSKLEKDELIKVIEKLESRKKYGLIWDEEKTKEQFEKESENALPVLKEVKGKEIKTDPSKPTNILIEGDNYHALSVLNYTHQGKIDIIYIDPPYNTGNKDFKYNDDYVDKEDAFRHSKWLSFMSKRLRLSKSLLKDEGVIFISIDDNEIAQLRMLCNEVFGEFNFIATLPTIMNLKGNQDQFGFAGTHEYTLVYCKNYSQASIREFILDEDGIEEWEQDDYGYYKKGANLKATGVNAPRSKRPNLFFPIFVTSDGILYVTDDDKPRNKKDIILLPITDNQEMSWRWSKNKIKNELYNLIFENNGSKAIYKKQRPSLGDLPSKKPKTIFYRPEYSSGNGTAQLKAMFGDKIFNNPKPLELIKDFLALGSDPKGIILDFMAGSGTTGHACLDMDNGSRQFILCTNNELNGLEKELKEKGLTEKEIQEHGICRRVTYPRLEKVIKGYKTPKGEKIDGLGGNLKYYKTAFVKNSISRDDLKMRITRECTEMLCLREGIFDEVKVKPDYHIFEQNGKIMGVYYSMERDSLAQLKKELDKMEGEKILYCFTFDPLGLDKNDFADWQGVSLEPIPQKILDIYEQIYEY